MAKYNKRRATHRKRQGGGGSASYGFGPAVSPGAPYASEVVAKSACLATPRPGELTGYTPPGMGGLPGFGGGGRRKKMNIYRKSVAAMRRLTRKVRGMFKRKMRGGRYTVDVGAAVGGPNVFVPNTRIGCEGGLVNTSPPGAAANPVPMRQSGGVGGVDSAYYAAPTAGYGNQPSTWVSSTGTPSLLQVPYAAREMNQACVKTGGGKRSKRSTRRKRQGGGNWMKKLKKLFKF
jgi:hypothetical protein